MFDAESVLVFSYSPGVESILGPEAESFGRWFLCVLKLVIPLLLAHVLFRPLLRSPREVRRHFLILILLAQGLSLQALIWVQNDGTWMEIGASVAEVVEVACASFAIWLFALLANILLSHSPAWTPPSTSCME